MSFFLLFGPPLDKICSSAPDYDVRTKSGIFFFRKLNFDRLYDTFSFNQFSNVEHQQLTHWKVDVKYNIILCLVRIFRLRHKGIR